jgi:two-component sensor histidine kinase/CheY-like chemotaxis protein
MRILNVEDSDFDAALIRAVLSQNLSGCEVTRVETREAFLEALQCDWDTILSDYTLPVFDGLSALKLALENRPEIPFIFVTGALSDELAVETIKSGATDYIAKHRLDRLPQAVTRAIRERELTKAKKEGEEKLRASLHEKELLLKEVHHRVKNNLQIICSLLSMQSDAVQDPLLASALWESQKRIHSMALIHEMLYGSSNLSDLDFGTYTQVLAAEISSSYGMDADRIRLILELEPIPFDIDHAIPCGLILNELLSNAFKYAFPDGRKGEIRVLLHQREGCITLAVKDNGVGLPPGQSAIEKKSLGLRIVNILARQLRGKLEITSNPGASFDLKFDAATDTALKGSPSVVN